MSIKPLIEYLRILRQQKSTDFIQVNDFNSFMTLFIHEVFDSQEITKAIDELDNEKTEATQKNT